MDTWLSLSQLITLSQQCGISRGALTPLIFSRSDESPTALPPFWADTKGRFNSQALPLLQVLADPHAVNGIAFILPDLIIEGSLCYPDSASDHPQISLLNSGEGLHLQSPIPRQSLLSVLQEQLLPANTDFEVIELSLPVLDTWLLWSIIDLGREQDSPALFSLEDIIEVLNRPYSLLQNLSAWYRQSFDLTQPTRRELESSLQGLAKRGLVEIGDAGGIKSAGMTPRLVQEFIDLNAFLMLKTSALLGEDGELVSMRNWIFQGSSGMGLLFFVSGGIAEMVYISPSNILNLVGRLLRDPFGFFPDNKKPARAVRPPPPEKL